MPQYYSILDNGQGKAKGKGMPRRNQNRTYGTKKVNYRMREGSNYYGDVTAAKKRKALSRTADSYGRGARSSGRSADSYGRGNKSRGFQTAEDARLSRGKKTSGKSPDARARGGARTSGRTADSRGRGNTSRGYLTAETNRQMRKAPNKNYRKGLYR